MIVAAMSSLAHFEDFLKQNCIRFSKNQPLSKYTTFNIGGPATYMAFIENIDQLIKLINVCQEYNIDYRILGGGSNLLVRDEGVDGVVISLSNFNKIHFYDNLVVAEANCPLPLLVRECVSRGLAGQESLAGIPGSVGGAVIMNAGGKYGQIGDLVEFVDVLSNGRLLRIPKSDIRFSYRDSSLKNKIVISVCLRLTYADKAQILARYKQIISEKRQTQPLDKPSAGCIFKNPPGLKAGKMIEECGLKGLQVGGAAVSEKHANFIVNQGRAKAKDVFSLIGIIQKRVWQVFKILLDMEVMVW